YFHATPPTETSTLSLHDALPISFRFAAQFAALLPKLAATHPVPSCGDAHLENFGTWRDAEGRLVWGVNDLDEAATLPFAADLVRSEEHTSELQSLAYLVCRLLLE